MIATIYAHYGVLGAEKSVIYNTGHGSRLEDIYDECKVEIPSRFKTSVNPWGAILIKLPRDMDWTLFDEIIYTEDDEPYILYIDDDDTEYHIKLKVLEVK